jgi:SAM-dependent methyltransferase
MDIGCGTGILSLFAAKAGAKKVIAIDASDMYKEAREIVLLNGYQDVISVVHGKVEDLIEKKGGEKLPLEEGEQVDVVISEWMGYGLFFETMLPSVMVVRDALMNKESGTMWPSRSILFLEGAKDSKIEYWSNVYGFNMNVMKDRVVKELRKDAEVEIVNAKDIVTNRDQVIVHDLNTCKDEELDFEVPFELKPNSDLDSCQIDKLVISFDIDFNTRNSAPTSFSTGCQTKPTHWKQTTLWFNPYDGVPVLASNEILKGTFHMERNDVNPRDMDFLVRWDVGSYPEIGSVFAKRMSGTIMSKLSSN